MKRKTLFVVLILIIAVAGLLSVIFTHDWSTFLDCFVSLLGLFSTVYAIVIAILLYDRFSVERDVLSKQNEAVSTLAQNLNLTYIYLTIHSQDKTEHFYFASDYKQIDQYPPQYKDYSLRITKNVVECLSSITHNVQLFYLPEDIYSNCSKLLGYSDTVHGISQTVGVFYAVIRCINPSSKDDFVLSDDDLYIIPQSFGEFFTNLKNLISSIDEWFIKHGYKNPRLQMVNFSDSIIAAESPYNPPQAMDSKAIINIEDRIKINNDAWVRCPKPVYYKPIHNESILR